MITLKQNGIILFLLFALALAGVGCSSQHHPRPSASEPSNDSAGLFPIQPTFTIASTESSGATLIHPTETKPIAPNESEPSATEPIKPGTTIDSDSTAPSETPPEVTDPIPSDPEVTQPPETEPTETNPEPTEPEETEPQPTEHAHSYSVSDVVAPSCESDGYSVYDCLCGDRYKDDIVPALGHSYTQKVTAPTCTAKGYTTYTCTSCGDSYQADKVSATGHSYVKEVTDPTCASKGYTTYTCSACGDTYRADEVPASDHNWSEWKVIKEATATEGGEHARTCTICGETETVCIPVIEMEMDVSTPATDEEAEVARLIADYINQFRAEEGSTQLTYLPGMSQVAQYRSRQLVTNFDHDTADMREAHAYYQYGEYVDLTKYGYDESYNYYSGHNAEAIGMTTLIGSPAQVASELATACKNSEGHWRYVGSSENSFIGVGVTYTADGWYLCILVGTTNYG